MEPTTWGWLAQGAADVPQTLAWLSAEELALLQAMRWHKRRVEWLTRRWTAKRVLAPVLGLDAGPAEWAALARLELAHEAGGAPFARLDGRPVPWALSLSDRAGWAVCLIGPGATDAAALGIDLEWVEPRSPAFVSDFFTPAEQAFVRGLPPGDPQDAAANLVWSAKEAALKVLKLGLRVDTRELEVRLGAVPCRDGWAPLSVCRGGTEVFPGWWRREGRFVLTVAARLAGEPPQPLAGGADLSRAAPLQALLQAAPLRPQAEPGA